MFDALTEHNGRYWREVWGEVQEQYGECALFVLLFEDSDPAESHRAFCEVVMPYMDLLSPLQMTVGYTILTDKAEISVETLMSSAEILAARDDPRIGSHRLTQGRSAPSGFKARTSGFRHG